MRSALFLMNSQLFLHYIHIISLDDRPNKLPNELGVLQCWEVVRMGIVKNQFVKQKSMRHRNVTQLKPTRSRMSFRPAGVATPSAPDTPERSGPSIPPVDITPTKTYGLPSPHQPTSL